MKENLKVLNIDGETEWREVKSLFFSLGFSSVISGLTFMFTDKHGLPCRDITLPELRELARPKEYLTSEFDLVVTNQPLDGFILVPDGAMYFSYYPISSKSKRFFIFKDDCGYIWDFDFNDWVLLSSQVCHQVLWERKENKVETVKGRFLHQEWIQKFIDGVDLQTRNISMEKYDAWYDLKPEHEFFIECFNDASLEFRLKPQTIQIGSRTIVKPISVKPENGQTYFIVDLMNKLKYRTNVWRGTDLDIYQFNSGLCHLTAQDSINCADALLELMK